MYEFLLLAEGAMETLGAGAGAGAVGIGATVAVLRWRANQAEKKDEKQDEKQDKLSDALANLHTTVVAQGSEIKLEISESEKRTDGKIVDLNKTVARQMGDLKELQAEQGTKLALLKNDQKHLTDRVESHAKKITRFGTLSGVNKT